MTDMKRDYTAKHHDKLINKKFLNIGIMSVTIIYLMIYLSLKFNLIKCIGSYILWIYIKSLYIQIGNRKVTQLMEEEDFAFVVRALDTYLLSGLIVLIYTKWSCHWNFLMMHRIKAISHKEDIWTHITLKRKLRQHTF